jgi:N-acetylglucosamine-6-sulfatase
VPRAADREKFADGPIPPVLPDTDEAYAELPAWLRGIRKDTEFSADRPYGSWPDFAAWYLDYHRTLLAVDDSVGRILASLADRGLAERTVVLFASDNGFMFGEKGVLDKRNFYEPSIRIPLLAHAPGLIPAGTRVKDLVLNVDLAPTILELLGLQPPTHWHGRSLAPLLRGERVDGWRQEFVYEYFFERAFPGTPTVFGLRTPRMKLGTYHGLDTPDELFDLEADPGETDNRIDDPGYADRRKGMMGRLKRHFDELGMLTDPVWGRNWLADPARAAEPLDR